MSDDLQTRIKQSAQYLDRFRKEPLGHFIAGTATAGAGEQFENQSPIDGAGLGRDGGDYSFDFYMETKNEALALCQHKTPRMGIE